MKISVITPVFNDHRVGRALDSILSQRHGHDLELIVVDAGSTDGTMEILRGYEDRIGTLVSETAIRMPATAIWFMSMTMTR